MKLMSANKTLVFLSMLFISFQVLALETDNYLAWTVELKDSTNAINGYIEEQINIAIEQANRRKYLPHCQEMTKLVARRFKTNPPMKHPMEDWLRENLTEEHVYPHNAWYSNESIYKYPSRFYLKGMMIAPNVRIGNVNLGTDKLSHFASTGRRYLEHYLKKIRKGYSTEEANKSAIRFGLWNEMTILGFWPGGVFSYGDMEANYQGFTFFKKLCLDETDPYLEQDENGYWNLKKSPNIGDYVSAYWDETFNLSIRDRWNWANTSYVIRKEYCPMMKDKKIIDRMENYRNAKHTSFSLEYIKELQNDHFKNSPIPEVYQSVEELCSEDSESKLQIRDVSEDFFAHTTENDIDIINPDHEL